MWRPLRRRLGITAFGTNLYSAEAVGKEIVEPHDETSLGHEEMYVVLRGRVRFTIDGETLGAPAGTVVCLHDTTLHRVAVAETEDALVLAVGNAPGKPYEPSPWEAWFLAHAAIRDGRSAKAIELLREAIAGWPEYADRVRTDPAFDAIRAEPGFPA